MKAITTSIASADSISERNWLHNVGSPGAFVSNVVSSNGMSGTLHLGGRAVGIATQHRVQHGRGIDRQRAAVRLDELTETIEQRTCHPKPDLHTVLVADVEQGPLDLPAHVPGDPIRRISAVQRSLVDRQVLRQLVELSPQPLRDEQLVESRPQLRHATTLRSGCRSYGDRGTSEDARRPVSHRRRQTGECRVLHGIVG